MQSPEYKVYDSHGTYQACAKEPHAAAILAEHYGGTVKWCHRHPVWTTNDISPLESFDDVTELVLRRCQNIREKAFKRA